MSSWLYRWPDLVLSSYVSKGVCGARGSWLLEELPSSQQPMMVLPTCITPSQLASLPPLLLLSHPLTGQTAPPGPEPQDLEVDR